MNKTLFSTPEVARWLGVFHTTVRRWIERGDIKGIRIGRNYKVPVDEAIRVLEAHEIPLPEILRKYRLKRKMRDTRLSDYPGRSSSILQKLLVVEEIEDPALICRQDVIMGTNQAFARLVGHSQADLIGVDVTEVMGEFPKDKLAEFSQEELVNPGKGISDYVAQLRTGNTEKKNVRINVSSFGQIRGVFLLVAKPY